MKKIALFLGIIILSLSCGKGTNYDALYISITGTGDWKASVRHLNVSFMRKDGQIVETLPKDIMGLPFETPKGLGDQPWVLQVTLKQAAAGKAWVRVEALAANNEIVAAGLNEFDLKNGGVEVVLAPPDPTCDKDGDGVVADKPQCKTSTDEPVDCDDNKTNVSPFVYVDECTNCYSENITGSSKDANCDGKQTLCKDQDNDGWPDCLPDSCKPGGTQENSAGCVKLKKGLDCDPKSADIHPGPVNVEYCDGIDNNCDGNIDEPGPNTKTKYGKAKGESCGMGICAGGTVVCDQKTKKAVCSTADRAAPKEICGNDLDDDCNGQTDSVAEGCGGSATDDFDGDGVPNKYEKDHCGACGVYAKYHSEVFPDYTDNNNAKVTHTAPEPCCSLSLKDLRKRGTAVPCQCDWNCDGQVKWCDENDKDGDGYIAGPDTDCNDSDPTIHQGAPEKCGDGVDQDCRGGDLSCDGVVDQDGDGYSPPDDCDDNNADVHPGAQETCDGMDDNCNGYVDDGNPGGGTACNPWGEVTYTKDACIQGVMVCNHTPGSDPEMTCVDFVGPVDEQCDGIDNNCDGKTDETFTFTDWNWKKLHINEGCGTGACAGGHVVCDGPDAVTCSTLSKTKPETCNYKDDDCDGQTDNTFKYQSDTGLSCHGDNCQGIAVGATCHGLGVCSGFTGTVECKDTNTVACSVGQGGSAYKGSSEICNYLDDNCDGKTDEGFDLKTMKNHCGKCEIECINPNGTTSCIGGKCSPVCKSGYWDCDANPINGCETDLAAVTQCGSCSTDQDCPKDFFCNGQNCIKKYAPPHSCTRPGQCHFGICTDEGVCCGDQCDGPCQSCKTGNCVPQANRSMPETDDGCQGFLCGNEGQCLAGCSSDADCLANHFCDTDATSATNYTCLPDMDIGGNCARINNNGNACVSGLCKDGVCCNTSCDSICMACNLKDSLGTCSAVLDDKDDDTCANTRQCNSNGVCKLINLQPCTTDDQCLSKNCKVDHDHNGKWCAESAQCVHDRVIYKNGDFSPDCWDRGNRAKCVNGVWQSDTCGDDTVCQDHYCDGGQCKVNNFDINKPCNNAPLCTAGKGDNRYITGASGDYICKGYCDGQGNCDYAKDCQNCNNQDGWYDYGDKGPGCKQLTDGTATQRDYTCSNAQCTFSVADTKNCDSLDGWYGGGNTAGCGQDQNSVQKDYFVDRNGDCQYKTNNCNTKDCDEQDKCSPVCDDDNQVRAFNDYYVKQNTNTCQSEYGNITDDCLTKQSEDTDEGPYDYLHGGAVTDYTQCQDGACVGTIYLDSCVDDTHHLDEYGVNGNGIEKSTVDCETIYGNDKCVSNDVYHESYKCTDAAAGDYCESAGQTKIHECGDSGCKGTCGTTNNGCEYHTRGCSDAACFDTPNDPDSDMVYCTGCNLHWRAGGEVDANTCCGDDPDEYYLTCTDSTSNGDCGTDKYACCNSSTDCVDQAGNCKTANACYIFGTFNKKSYCYDGIWEDPDNAQLYCEDSSCGYTWLLDSGKCCGDDPGESFENPGTGNDCCYNGSVLASGKSSGSVLCYEGHLYDCNGSGNWINKITCNKIVGLYCTDTNTWATKKSNTCSCAGDTDCLSGHCASDYDGSGSWCEPDGKCAHNARDYAAGSNGPNCKDDSNTWQCNNGSWTAHYCGTSYCENNSYHVTGCNTGSCLDTPNDPDSDSTYCTGCNDKWLANGTGTNSQCCGDDTGEDFENSGTGNDCCYNAAILASAAKSDSVLCCDGLLYYCGKKPDDLAVGTAKTNGETVCGKTCTADGTGGGTWQ